MQTPLVQTSLSECSEARDEWRLGGEQTDSQRLTRTSVLMGLRNGGIRKEPPFDDLSQLDIKLGSVY